MRYVPKFGNRKRDDTFEKLKKLLIAEINQKFTAFSSNFSLDDKSNFDFKNKQLKNVKKSTDDNDVVVRKEVHLKDNDINLNGKQIKNIAPPRDLSDAVNFDYLLENFLPCVVNHQNSKKLWDCKNMPLENIGDAKNENDAISKKYLDKIIHPGKMELILFDQQSNDQKINPVRGSLKLQRIIKNFWILTGTIELNRDINSEHVFCTIPRALLSLSRPRVIYLTNKDTMIRLSSKNNQPNSDLEFTLIGPLNKEDIMEFDDLMVL